MGKGFQHPSGRVIALGRLILAALFLLAIWIDASQPARAPAATYVVLAAYVAFAAAIVVATWSNWWLDAKLAGPAHAVDIILFTLLVLLTEGYTSPFFTFFMFVLLSAATRLDKPGAAKPELEKMGARIAARAPWPGDGPWIRIISRVPASVVIER